MKTLKECKKRRGFNNLILEIEITSFLGSSKDHHFTPERVEVLKALSQKEDVYDRLAYALAPSIYENEDIKKGILLQLFGGTKKKFTSMGRTNFRAEINILLCGDPGKFDEYVSLTLAKGELMFK